MIPGGFGPRGTEGKIIAIKYARENNIPLFGICFGCKSIYIFIFYENISNSLINCYWVCQECNGY